MAAGIGKAPWRSGWEFLRGHKCLARPHAMPLSACNRMDMTAAAGLFTLANLGLAAVNCASQRR